MKTNHNCFSLLYCTYVWVKLRFLGVFDFGHKICTFIASIEYCIKKNQSYAPLKQLASAVVRFRVLRSHKGRHPLEENVR